MAVWRRNLKPDLTELVIKRAFTCPSEPEKAESTMEIQHHNHMLQILYFSFLLRINSPNKFSLHLCEALQIEPQKQKLITF